MSAVYISAALVVYAVSEALYIRRLYRAGKAPTWKRCALKRAAAALCGALFITVCYMGLTSSVKIPRYVSESVTGAELVFVLDVSNSMLCADQRGGISRLDAAKHFIYRLCESIPKAGNSLVIYKGMAVTLCPPTYDNDAFFEALRWAEPVSLSAKGSNMAAGIAEAARPGRTLGKSKIYIILSDGNITHGSIQAASKSKNDGTYIFVGFGSAQAVQVFDSERKPVLSAAAEPVYSALNESGLSEAAILNGGFFVRASDATAFAQVLSVCAAEASLAGHRRMRRVEVDASAWLALCALAAFGAAFILSSPLYAKKTMSVVLIALLSSCGQYSGFMILKANRLFEEGRYNEAAALYIRAGAGSEATASYNLANVFMAQNEKAAAEALHYSIIKNKEASPEVRALSWYNKGVYEYAQGSYVEARGSFKEALLAYIHEKGSAAEERRRMMSAAFELASKKEMSQSSGVRQQGAYTRAQFSGLQNTFTLFSVPEQSRFTAGAGNEDITEDQ